MSTRTVTETLVGRENVYTCQKCGGHTVTVDVDDGVTPFMLNCRASGEPRECSGMAMSACYPTGPRPSHIGPPAWEWYAPGPAETAALDDGMRHHVEQGGLMLRRKTDA